MPPVQLGLVITSLLFLQLISGSTTQDSCSASEAPLARLKRNLLCGYDKMTRPVASEIGTAHVSLFLSVRYVDFVEANRALTVSTWMSLKWKDVFLNWDPRAYHDINSITLSSKDIWIPDILFLPKGHSLQVSYGLPTTECRVESGGDVHCSPLITHVAHCLGNLTRWPFDKRTCNIDLGSWSYQTSQLNTTLEGKGISTEQLKPTSVWELLETSTDVRLVDIINNETYTEIQFFFTLKRHSGAHLATVVIPALILSVMTLLTLLLEASCTERITLGCMNVLAHCLYLQYLGMKLPPNGDTVPAIAVFFRDSMFMVGASLVLAVLVRVVSRSRTEPPAWLASIIGAILSSRPGQILLLSQLSSISGAAASPSGHDIDALVGTENGGGAGVDGERGNCSDRGAATEPGDTTWQHAARLLDRVGLVIFCVTFLVLLVGYVP